MNELAFLALGVISAPWNLKASNVLSLTKTQRRHETMTGGQLAACTSMHTVAFLVTQNLNVRARATFPRNTYCWNGDNPALKEIG